MHMAFRETQRCWVSLLPVPVNLTYILIPIAEEPDQMNLRE